MTPESLRISPISPESIDIAGVKVIPRTLHFDARGFLIETLRRDDPDGERGRFAMSYTSVTVPGAFRDQDRWHVHRVQTDRFVVAIGEMTLALYDGRDTSATKGHLDITRMSGAPFDHLNRASREDLRTFLVTIPPGVYHCIGNLSDYPFVLVNSPTELYDVADEGRVSFDDVPIRRLRGPFRWDKVEGSRP